MGRSKDDMTKLGGGTLQLLRCISHYMMCETIQYLVIQSKNQRVNAWLKNNKWWEVVRRRREKRSEERRKNLMRNDMFQCVLLVYWLALLLRWTRICCVDLLTGLVEGVTGQLSLQLTCVFDPQSELESFYVLSPMRWRSPQSSYPRNDGTGFLKNGVHIR